MTPQAIPRDVVKIKYDVPNDRLDILDGYIGEIDAALAEIKG